jgi:hypothetical protein
MRMASLLQMRTETVLISASLKRLYIFRYFLKHMTSVLAKDRLFKREVAQILDPTPQFNYKGGLVRPN